MLITSGQEQPTSEVMTPFAGLRAVPPPDAVALVGPGDRLAEALESPFGAGFSEQSEQPDRMVAEFLEQLADEDFNDAVASLLDEAAAKHLADQGAWTVRPTTAESLQTLEAWIEPLAEAAERSLDQLSDRLGGVDPSAMTGREFAELLDSISPEQQTGVEGFDEFLGGLVRKAKKLAKGAVDLAKKGIAAVGKILPIGPVLDKLKALVPQLLDRVLKAALNKLPPSVRTIARTLAAKFKLGEAESMETDPVTRVTTEFDLEVAGLLYDGAVPELQEAAFAAESVEAEAGDGRAASPVAELDAARERLATRLTELPPGAPPVAEIEQFIPAVMAVRPLIKLGMSIVGRDKIVGFLADRIAGLIKGMVGQDAANQISRPLVDVGLRMLGFEVPAGEDKVLAGEALAGTVEGTVLRVLELPAAAFEDELQLDAAVQQAFAEAAAAAMPDRLLRADLPERETADEGGAWVLMPRQARPAYRYRQFTRVFLVPVSRQMARAVPWSDGGTMESYLLDRGAQRWPVEAEVSLYEAVPGTHLGHLVGDRDEAAEAGEIQPLTPDIAGLLLREPALGRRGFAGAAHGVGAGRPVAGQRFFRVRPAGLPRRRPRRPRRRLLVWLDLGAANPSLRIALRLSERKAQQLLAKLQPPAADVPGVLAALTRHYSATLAAALASRLRRLSPAPDATQAGAITDRVKTAVDGALSTFLTERAAQLAAAVQDPANGITITVTFPGVTREALDGTLPAPTVAVQPGWRRG